MNNLLPCYTSLTDAIFFLHEVKAWSSEFFSCHWICATVVLEYFFLIKQEVISPGNMVADGKRTKTERCFYYNFFFSLYFFVFFLTPPVLRVLFYYVFFSFINIHFFFHRHLMNDKRENTTLQHLSKENVLRLQSIAKMNSVVGVNSKFADLWNFCFINLSLICIK